MFKDLMYQSHSIMTVIFPLSNSSGFQEDIKNLIFSQFLIIFFPLDSVAFIS